MRKQLYNFMKWALLKALGIFPHSSITKEEYLMIAESVWDDMDDGFEMIVEDGKARSISSPFEETPHNFF